MKIDFLLTLLYLAIKVSLNHTFLTHFREKGLLTRDMNATIYFEIRIEQKQLPIFQYYQHYQKKYLIIKFIRLKLFLMYAKTPMFFFNTLLLDVSPINFRLLQQIYRKQKLDRLILNYFDMKNNSKSNGQISIFYVFAEEVKN